MITSAARPPLSLAAALAALALAGCATLEAVRRQPGTLADGNFVPGRPGSPSFGADPSRLCPAGGAYTQTYDQLAKAVEEKGATPAVADGQLCAMAEAFLGWSAEELPREAVRAFVARHFGLVTGAPQINISMLETEDTRLIGESLTSVVTQFGNQVGAPRYGLAVERVGKGRTRVVLALMNARVALSSPLPRRLELGQKATLAGTLLGDLEAPRVLVSDTHGVLTDVPAAPGKAFKAEVACGATPGRVIVEIRGEEMGSELVLATLILPCGGPPLPTSVALAATPWPAGVAEQEALIVKAIDAERTGAGLKPIPWSEPVARIARAVSEGLRDTGARKGGVPAAGVNVAQLLSDADIQASLVMQNPAVGPTAEIANDRLLASPSHRVSVMTPDLSAGGVGVAVGSDPAGKPIAYLTQLFLKIQPLPDVEAALATIRESIDKKRVAEKAPPLAVDPALEKLARDYAATVAAAGGPPPKAKTEELVAALKKGFRDTTFLVDARIDLADFAEDPNAVAKGKLVGLGGALGRHPRLGKNTLFVVLIIANKAPAGKK